MNGGFRLPVYRSMARDSRGLAAARKLASAPADILVIDRHNYNLFQPLLYQVATAGLSPADIAAPIRNLLSATNTRVLLDEVVEVDPVARQLRMRSGGEQGDDMLILATGSEYNYFGHDEWRGLAPGLKWLDDATNIPRSVLLAFERAELDCERGARSTADIRARRCRPHRRRARRRAGRARPHHAFAGFPQH